MDIENIVIVALGISALTLWIFGTKWMDMKNRRIEADAALTAEKAAQYAAKTERLEQRVAVLERILTDRSATLGQEIESLRDEPLN